MAIQQRFTVSVIWTDGMKDSGKLVSVVLDSSSPEAAARIALAKHFPLHKQVWVYSWLSGENQLKKFERAERGKVAMVGVVKR